MSKRRKKNRSHHETGRSQAPLERPSPGVLPESFHPDEPPQAARGGALTKLAAGLFGAALVIALYLAWQSATGGSMPGCGPESACRKILNSRWSAVGPVPVSLLGAAVYAALLACALSGGPCPQWRRRLEWGASVLVLGGALWFTIVQAYIIKAFCPWCCAAHFLASAGVVALWSARRQEPESVAASGPGLAEFALPLAAVAGMAVIQSRMAEPERIVTKTVSQSVVAGPGTISLYDGKLVLDSTSLPSIGEPNSTVTAVAVTDFTCPHCRELHGTLTQLAGQRPGQFRAVLLPAAFEPEARELHRIMLSLWRIDPEGYRKIAEDLTGGSIDPNVKDVLAAVQKRVNGRFYEMAWAQAGWVQDTVRQGEELRALNDREAGASTLPQLMIRDRVLTGAPHLNTLVTLLDAAPSRVAAASTATAAQPPAPPAPTGAAIAFDSMTLDFGTVTKGDPATKKVAFTNSGRDPLIISNIKTSCGCTTVQGAQQTVAPGKQGSFELRLDTARFTGAITKSVDVESNASNGMVRLTLKANIWSPVMVTPSTVSFGSLLKGTKVTPRKVEITVTEPEPMKLGAVTSSNPYFQTELKAVEEGRKYELTVSVPNLGELPQNAEFVLELPHPKMKQFKLSAFINPVDPLVVQPTLINISSATLKTDPSISITVYCHDPAVASLEVTDLAYSGGGGVTVAFERQGASKWGRVVLTFPAGFDPAKAKDAQVSFRTNHPKYPQFTLPVHFIATPPVAVSPAASSIR